MTVNRRTFLKFLGLTGPGALTIVRSNPLKAEVGVDRKQEQYRTGNREEIAGKTQNWMKAKVFNADTGEELKHVVEANEKTGRVVKFALDKDGNIRHTRDDILHETVYMRVRIERPT